MPRSTEIAKRAGFAVGLLAVGYLIGATGALQPSGLQAQSEQQGLTQETADKIQDAYNAVNAAMLGLKNEGRYRPATKGLNSFAVLSGGADAMADLQAGRGVDPVTFAALYAGRALPEVDKDLSYDDQGRLLYNNRVVRMYPISRLKTMFAQQARLAGIEEEDGSP